MKKDNHSNDGYDNKLVIDILINSNQFNLKSYGICAYFIEINIFKF
ncbi:MAG: hypothetical protein J1F31_04080 [Erysipelotrichales bacterium]|nr:hypothetical protein [Erysipelotrichales bacterium]